MQNPNTLDETAQITNQAEDYASNDAVQAHWNQFAHQADIAKGPVGPVVGKPATIGNLPVAREITAHSSVNIDANTAGDLQRWDNATKPQAEIFGRSKI